MHARIMGRPNHVTLATIATIRQSEFLEAAERFWAIVDEKLDDLVRRNTLWETDRKKCQQAFAKHISRPAAVVGMTTSVPDTDNYETMQKLIKELSSQAEKKLEERGY